MNKTAEKTSSDERGLQELGRITAESIAADVAAIECDYERLRELRECGSNLSKDDCEELAELTKAAGEFSSQGEALERMQEHPLSVEVRTGWYTPGSEDNGPEEFCILLGTGAPAVRIRGELDQHCYPSRAWIETQDWFKPWTEYRGDAISQADLLTYCQQLWRVRCNVFGKPKIPLNLTATERAMLLRFTQRAKAALADGAHRDQFERAAIVYAAVRWWVTDEPVIREWCARAHWEGNPATLVDDMAAKYALTDPRVTRVREFVTLMEELIEDARAVIAKAVQS
jgi:hypothetical protein